MTSHRRKTVTLTSLSVRQWARIVAIFVGFVSVVTLGIASRNFYSASKNHSAKPYITAYSATDSANQVSRGTYRNSLKSVKKRRYFLHNCEYQWESSYCSWHGFYKR